MNRHLTIQNIFLGLLFSISFLSACQNEQSGFTTTTPTTTNCSGTTYSFSTDVNPIIQKNCSQSGCHNSSSRSGTGPLTTYSEINNAKGQIKSSVESGSMPRGSALSTEEKNTIICWINNGGDNN